MRFLKNKDRAINIDSIIHIDLRPEYYKEELVDWSVYICYKDYYGGAIRVKYFESENRKAAEAAYNELIEILNGGEK